MRTAGKAFIGGLAGTFGVAAAVILTGGIVFTLGQRKMKRLITDLESELSRRTALLCTDMWHEQYGPGRRESCPTCGTVNEEKGGTNGEE